MGLTLRAIFSIGIFAKELVDAGLAESIKALIDCMGIPIKAIA